MTGGQLFTEGNMNIILHADSACTDTLTWDAKRDEPVRLLEQQRDLDMQVSEPHDAEIPEQPLPRSADDLNLVPMEFKGEIGGHYVELDGTIQVGLHFSFTLT